MTFIATVVAKKGVAIIADSLVTTVRPILELQDFENLLKNKIAKPSKEPIKIDPAEIGALFKKRPSHTKDFEEKLFEYDKYTAITTAGAAVINGLKIEKVIDNIVKHNNSTKERRSYARKRIFTKVKDFGKKIEVLARQHINKYSFIGSTTFLITHFDKIKETVSIHKVTINGTRKKNLNPNTELVTIVDRTGHKVVCDGQNRISEKILYGELLHLLDFVPQLVAKISQDCPQISSVINNKEYIMNLLQDKDLISKNLIDDMKIYKLTDLSLQQAADLANLLMRIEMDIQKFTENIPVVGGVIKLAVIDKNGFKFISGHEIILHNDY